MADCGRPRKGEYQVRTFRIKQDAYDALSEVSFATGFSKTCILEQAVPRYAEEWRQHPESFVIQV